MTIGDAIAVCAFLIFARWFLIGAGRVLRGGHDPWSDNYKEAPDE